MTRRSFMQRLAMTVVAGVAGFVLNAYLPAFARLLPGRVVTLPIAILFGPAFGGIAALIGAFPASRAYPVFMVVLGLEGLLVGVAARQNRASPLLAGALVWTIAAAILLVAPDWFGVGQEAIIWPTALRQLLNGMVAVAVADLVASAIAARFIRDRTAPPRLRAFSFQAFVLVGILPVLLLSAANGELSAARQETEGGARLHEAVTALTAHVESYVETHQLAVQSLAYAAQPSAPTPCAGRRSSPSTRRSTAGSPGSSS